MKIWSKKVRFSLWQDVFKSRMLLFVCRIDFGLYIFTFLYEPLVKDMKKTGLVYSDHRFLETIFSPLVNTLIHNFHNDLSLQKFIPRKLISIKINRLTIINKIIFHFLTEMILYCFIAFFYFLVLSLPSPCSVWQKIRRPCYQLVSWSAVTVLTVLCIS